jgi:hypothetical protein
MDLTRRSLLSGITALLLVPLDLIEPRKKLWALGGLIDGGVDLGAGSDWSTISGWIGCRLVHTTRIPNSSRIAGLLHYDIPAKYSDCEELTITVDDRPTERIVVFSHAFLPGVIAGSPPESLRPGRIQFYTDVVRQSFSRPPVRDHIGIYLPPVHRPNGQVFVPRGYTL